MMNWPLYPHDVLIARAKSSVTVHLLHCVWAWKLSLLFANFVRDVVQARIERFWGRLAVAS